MATNKIRKSLAAGRASALARGWRRLTAAKSVSIDGFVVSAEESRVGRTAAHALRRGSYEEAERFLARKCLRRGDRVIEAGAGIGLVTMNIARTVGAENLIVYEASPVAAEILQENLRRNGFAVDVRNRGLSDRATAESFVRSDNIRGSSFVAPREGATIEVTTDDIAQVLADWPANALVLDIEGKEIDVLLRAPLDAIDKIIVEIHPRHLGDAPYLQLYRRLFDAGFLLRHALSMDDVLFFERAERSR